MTIQFRNIDVDRGEPLDRWPAEAIETIIDRGSLADWRQLADAIRRNPWGSSARTAETVVGWGEHYGVDALISRVIRHAREEVTQRGRTMYAEQIRAWRAQTGLTLRQFASAAGTSASRLSDYENAKVSPSTDVLGRLSHVAKVHGAGMLSLEPRRAGDVLVSLFEATVDRIEHPLPVEEGMTSEQAQRLRQERAEDADRFFKRCYELADMITRHATDLENDRE